VRALFICSTYSKVNLISIVQLRFLRLCHRTTRDNLNCALLCLLQALYLGDSSHHVKIVYHRSLLDRSELKKITGSGRSVLTAQDTRTNIPRPLPSLPWQSGEVDEMV
jgi:hypothetical protein